MKLPGKLSKEIVLLVLGTVLAGFYIIKKLGWFVINQSNVNIDKIGSDLVTGSDKQSISMVAFATISSIQTNQLTGYSTGQCSVEVLGGTPPYTYLWSGAGFTNQTERLTDATSHNPAVIRCRVTDSTGSTTNSNSVNL